MPSDVNMVGAIFTTQRVVVTRSRLVDEVLQDGSPDHGCCSEHEPAENLGDGSEGCISPNEWVQEVFADWNEDDKGDGVYGLEEVVGQAMELHGGALSDEVVKHVTIGGPIYGVEAEDLARGQGSLNLIDEFIRPGEVFFWVVRGLRGVEVQFVSANDPGSLEALGDDLVAHGLLDVHVFAGDKHNDSDPEEAEGKQVRGPKAPVGLEFGGRDDGERADVDHEVEEHEHVLQGDVRVLDDALALLGDHDAVLALGQLVRDQHGQVRLDEARRDADEDDGDDKPAERRVT